MPSSIGILESRGWSVGIVALDQMGKSASVTVVQTELNDQLGVCITIRGSTADVKAAIETGKACCAALQSEAVGTVIAAPASGSEKNWKIPVETSPLIEQQVVRQPGEGKMADNNVAIGFIETQGFTAVIEAVDSACKAASVEIVGREKLGGGYIAVVIKGDVAAVKAAVDAGKSKVEGLGKLIAAHVIARPTPGTWGLLPK